MGDDVGNIIYLLLILLSVVFSAFRKKKKPMAPPPPQEKKQRPALDPMQEFESFLEKFDDQKKDVVLEEEPILEELENEEPFAESIEDEEPKNPFMQHLEDERFKEAVPQTFSDEKLYSDDIRDIAPPSGSDISESSIKDLFGIGEEKAKLLKKKKLALKKFNAKDAIVYSAIINRPYQ